MVEKRKKKPITLNFHSKCSWPLIMKKPTQRSYKREKRYRDGIISGALKFVFFFIIRRNLAVTSKSKKLKHDLSEVLGA